MPHSEPKYHPLHQSRFYAIRSKAKLAVLFGHTRKTLNELLVMQRPYTCRTLEQERNGKIKTRIIQEPRGALRPIHITVRKALSRIQPPDFLFCPVKGRSYVSNAAQHANARDVRKLDIKNYFPSTSRHRVVWFFRTVMHCSPDVAWVLGRLLTVDDHLATGSTVSPILSFFAFYDMWLAISDIAKRAGCVLTVYIDDLSVSCSRVPGPVLWAIKQEIHKRGLDYHKERRYTRGPAEVTGILIRDGKLLVPNRQRKKAYDVRAKLAQTEDPTEATKLAAVLRGLDQQRKQVEGQSSRR
jgi:hypothetical protein